MPMRGYLLAFAGDGQSALTMCGYRILVIPQLSKLLRGVRFPLPAPPQCHTARGLRVCPVLDGTGVSPASNGAGPIVFMIIPLQITNNPHSQVSVCNLGGEKDNTSGLG